MCDKSGERVRVRPTNLSPLLAAPEPASREELLELSVGQLKKLARERGVDVSTALEKAHIVDALLSARKE